MGLCLGHDLCYDHEQGSTPLQVNFGVNTGGDAVGIIARKITVCPDDLVYTEYMHKPLDKRRKGVKAASLVYRPGRIPIDAINHQHLLRELGLKFLTEIGQPYYKAESDDLVCAWSEREFGINVRGAINIERLQQLYKAFQACDVALCHPSVDGLLRQGLSFAICSRVPAETQKTVEAQDLAHNRLMSAMRNSGVEAMLQAAGKRWHALCPGWMRPEKEDELVFFINPAPQSISNFGWFTIPELEQWAQGTGPVVRDRELEEISREHNRGDWQFNLVRGLTQAGVKIRFQPRLAWLDKPTKQVGVFLRVLESSDGLTTGTYTFDELLAKYPNHSDAEAAV